MAARTILAKWMSTPTLIGALLILNVPLVSAMDTQATISGRINLESNNPLQMAVYKDDYGASKIRANRVNYLPPFSFDYVQYQGRLIPIKRGSIPGSHPVWEYILEPGTITPSPGGGNLQQATLPFTLQERNANCMHYGRLRFSLGAKGSISKVEVAIYSETCANFKFDLRGLLQASFTPAHLDGAEQAIAIFNNNRAARMIVKPIGDIKSVDAGVDLDAFTGGGKLPIADITLYGFVMDGIHYRGECRTRRGSYAFCNDINLPSYSIAKSLFAGLAAMRLENLHPGSMDSAISDYVPECAAVGSWQDVTLSHTLNMLTGHYESGRSHTDESSKENDSDFFAVDRHSQKINFSCKHWPRKKKPGNKWVYHTSDTYLLGTAMNARLQSFDGADADIYKDLLLPLWQNMDLSPASKVVRRSYDEISQVFTGYGMTLLPDDIARLATALNQRKFADELDKEMYDSAMQRMDEPQGSFPVDLYYYYKNGFWAYNAQSLLGCSRPVMVPFMSGYGGINIVMMPNDTVYYIFSDGGKFAFADMLVQSHKMRSMCPKK